MLGHYVFVGGIDGGVSVQIAVDCRMGGCAHHPLFVIGVHSLMAGTAAPDFGGRKATATCSGIADGFVYWAAACNLSPWVISQA
jgi:hypothetical protein